ncbi:hypothetical protein ACHAXT_005419 [Thalassiosira profunda]
MKVTASLCLLCPAAALAFTPPAARGGASRCAQDVRKIPPSALCLSAEPAAAESTSTDSGDLNASLEIPLTYSEMISQASQCMSDAYAQGIDRQIVRILLPRDAANDQLGQYDEADAEISNRAKSQDMKLVPTDESWQGGIMQLYRAASPTTKDILRQLSPTTKATGVPPTIVEDRSIDDSGVDGVGLLYTQSGGGEVATTIEEKGGFGFFGESVKLPTLAETDLCAFVQPSQEVVDVIDDLSSKSASAKPLIALLNPQWRNVDDALDSASKSGGVVGAFASFLGGKGSVLRRLDELGYRPTYTLEGYVCKGGNIRMVKRFDSDWIVFAENDSGDAFVRVGSMGDRRPSYQDVEKMLDDKGVGYKYARDLGMAPKL